MAYANPSTWVAGAVLTAAQLNEQVRDNLDAAFPLAVDAWESWTPTFTNFTLGNGTVMAAYMRVGRMIFWRLKVTLGSTSSMGTNPTFTLPVAPHADYAAGVDFMGNLIIGDSGTADFNGMVRKQTGSAVGLQVSGVGGTYDTQTNVTATVPMTWTTSDRFAAYGTYEAAA